MDQLSGLDSLFALNETSNAPMHIGALMLYDPVGKARKPLQFEQVYQAIGENIHKSPVFQRKLMPVPYKLDKPYWAEDRSFELDEHLEHIDAAELESEQDLWQCVADIQARGLDMSKPLWRATFIEGIGEIVGYSEGTTGLFIQVHHSAIDGMSGTAILAALHSLSEEISPTGELELPRAKRPSPAWWLAFRANSTRFNRNWRNSVIIRDIVRSIQLWRAHIGDPDQEERPHNKWAPSPFNSRVSSERNIAVLSMPFEEIRTVKNSVEGATVNHVALAVVGGALRSYLQQQEKLPENSLSACVPINVRNPEDENAGNVLSATITALRTDIEAPRERLETVRDAAVEAKESAGVLGETTLLDISSVLSQRMAQTLLRLVSVVTSLPLSQPMPFNTIVSNVAGSPIDLYFAGARMNNMHALGLIMNGLGLFHTATSYKDSFSITALSSPSCLPDIDLYQQCLEQSWQELREASQKS